MVRILHITTKSPLPIDQGPSHFERGATLLAMTLHILSEGLHVPLTRALQLTIKGYTNGEGSSYDDQELTPMVRTLHTTTKSPLPIGQDPSHFERGVILLARTPHIMGEGLHMTIEGPPSIDQGPPADNRSPYQRRGLST